MSRALRFQSGRLSKFYSSLSCSSTTSTILALSRTLRTSIGMVLSLRSERSSSPTSLKPPPSLIRSLIYLMMLPLIVKTNYKLRYIIFHIHSLMYFIWFLVGKKWAMEVIDLLWAYLILSVLGQQLFIIYLFVIAVMFSSFLPRTYSLTNRIAQTFAKFDRAKAHVNVGTIGHIDHGKTTLTSAITKYLASKNKGKYIEYAKIDKAPEQKARGITINTATLEYETDLRHYAHVDCPGHIDYVKNMITGAAKMDAGILVVSAIDGPMPQTKQHVLLCRQIGVGNILIFLNKMDLVKEFDMIQLIEEELKDLLRKHDYDPDKSAFIRGSAISYIQDMNPEIGQKSIEALLKAMDEKIEIAGRPVDKPFYMAVESTYGVAGRGAVACGTVEQGRIKIGDDIQFFGYNKNYKSQVVGIETFNKTLDYGEAGDNVGILVRGVTREQINRGLVIGKPGSLNCNSVIQANIYVLKTQEGGRINPFSSGYRPQLYFKTADTAAEICLPEGVKIAKPGDNLTVRAKLNFPITIQKGSRFALRQGGKTIAAGLVTQILPETTELDFGKQKRVKAVSQNPAPVPGQTKAGDTKAGDKGAKSPAKGAQTKPAAGKTNTPPAGTAPPAAGKTPPPPAGKTPPPTAGKTPPPPAGKTPPPPTAGKTAPPPPAGKTPPPPPAGKTPPPPPAGKTTPPPPGAKSPAKPMAPPPKAPPKK